MSEEENISEEQLPVGSKQPAEDEEKYFKKITNGDNRIIIYSACFVPLKNIQDPLRLRVKKLRHYNAVNNFGA